MILTVGNEKGGVGKSVIACNLSVMRAKEGREVLLVDADKKPSSSLFARVRTDEGISPEISCVSITGRTLLQEIRRLKSRYDDIIIDCGGEDNTTLRAAMVACEILLIPMKPGAFDYWTLEGGMADKVNEVMVSNEGMKPLLFINQGDSNPMKKFVLETKETILSNLPAIAPDIQLLESVVCNRAIFEHSVGRGLAVFEFISEIGRPQAGYRNGVNEISRLYKEVFGEEFKG